MYNSSYPYNPYPHQQSIGSANPMQGIQNPMAAVQNRLSQYDQQQFLQQQQQAPFTNSPSVRMVTSIEEVRAISIPFDGSVSYFHDKANGKVYTKSIDLNGLPQIQVYKFDPTALNQNTPKDDNNVDFVSKKEFEELKQQIQKYEIIYAQLMGNDSKGVSKNDE